MCRKKNNLNDKERKALRDLSSSVRNNEFVTCRADKDGKVIVITYEGYQAVMNALLEKFDKIPIPTDKHFTTSF